MCSGNDYPWNVYKVIDVTRDVSKERERGEQREKGGEGVGRK